MRTNMDHCAAIPSTILQDNWLLDSASFGKTSLISRSLDTLAAQLAFFLSEAPIRNAGEDVPIWEGLMNSFFYVILWPAFPAADV